MRRTTLVALGLLIALIAAACGDNEAPPSTAADTAALEQAQAEAAAAQAEADAAAAEADAAATAAAEAEAALEAAMAEAEGAIDPEVVTQLEAELAAAQEEAAEAAAAAEAAKAEAAAAAEPEPEPESGESITLYGITGDQPGMEPVIAAFTEATGIEVNANFATGDADITVVNTQLNAGTGPDVMFSVTGSGNAGGLHVRGGAGFLADLSDMDFASRIPATLLPGLGLDGELYGVPVGGTAVGVLWNLTAMEEHGFALPQTWSDMLQLCADARAIGKSAWAMGGADGWPTIMVPYALSATLIYGATPDFDQRQLAQEVTFSNSAWVDVMNQYVEAIDAGCFQENALGTGFIESLSMVARGDALGAPQVNALLALITAEAPEGTRLTIAPIPATENAEETRITASLGANYAVNRESENMAAARAFIDFLASDEGLELYLTNSAGFPILTGGNFELDPTLDILLQHLADDKIGLIPDQTWTSPQVQVAMIDGLQGLLLGSTDVATVLAAMDAEYEDGLAG